jgi:hypothetical protein
MKISISYQLKLARIGRENGRALKVFDERRKIILGRRKIAFNNK